MSLRRVILQFRSEWNVIMRNGEQLLLTLVIPMVLLGFFGSVEVLPLGDGDPLGVLVPGVLAVAVVSAAMVSLGIATGFERSYLVLKRLGATPLRRGELVVAKALAVSAVEVVQATLLLGLALLLGWRGAGTDIVLAVPAVLLGTLAFAGLGLLLAGRLRAEVNLAAQTGLYIVLVLAGGMIVPPDELPGVLGSTVEWLPTHALASCLSQALSNGPGGSHWWIIAAWAATLPVVAARRFRWW
ncbi:MAG: ABC transporter permease [Actinomycetota bacterium]